MQSKLLVIIKEKWKNILSFILGSLVALSIPFITNIISKPEIRIELNQIQKDVDDSITIDLIDYPELNLLIDYYDEIKQPTAFSPIIALTGNSKKEDKNKEVNVNQLKTLLLLLEEDLSILPNEIKDLTNEIEQNKSSTTIVGANLQGIVYKTPEDRLDSLNKKLVNIRNSFTIVEKKVNKIINENVKKNSKFYIKASLLNTGLTSISIKNNGLLRLFLPDDSFIDFDVEIINLTKTPVTVEPNQISNISLQTKNISSFSENDEQLILKSWDTSGYCVLFLEDVFKKINYSNELLFTDLTNLSNQKKRLVEIANNYIKQGK